LVGQPALASPPPVLEDAGRGLEDITLQMLELFAVASLHNAEKNLLDEIVDFIRVANMTLKIPGERATQNLRPVPERNTRSG